MLRVLVEPHRRIELNAVFGGFVVRKFDFANHLLRLLGEEIEEDDLAEALVAEVLIDGEMFDIDKIVESPIAQDTDGVALFVAVAVGGHEEMEPGGVTVLERTKRRPLFLRKGVLEQILSEARMI